MIDLDAFDHLSHDGVIIFEFVLLSLVKGFLEECESIGSAFAVELGFPNRIDTFGQSIDFFRYALEYILMSFYIGAVLYAFIYNFKHFLVEGFDSALEQVNLICGSVQSDGIADCGFHQHKVCFLIFCVEAVQSPHNRSLERFVFDGQAVLAVLGSVVKAVNTSPYYLLFAFL